ncbi:MAG: LuxR C-terminal-related transcriptional regulator [Nitrospira sp.]
MPSTAMPTLTITILSSQCLVWLGLQKILESSATVPMVVQPYPGSTSDLLRAECHPDVFILDLETERDALSTLKQIREAAPISKIVLLCGLEDQDRTREAFAAGVDGIILKVQPPEVVLAVIAALSASAKSPASLERDRAGKLGLGPALTNQVESDPPRPAWPEDLTEREREIIRLVRQGLSNKDIAYKLSISDSTVRHHMTSIFDKVGVPNRQKLLVHAHQFRTTPV